MINFTTRAAWDLLVAFFFTVTNVAGIFIMFPSAWFLVPLIALPFSLTSIVLGVFSLMAVDRENSL